MCSVTPKRIEVYLKFKKGPRAVVWSVIEGMNVVDFGSDTYVISSFLFLFIILLRALAAAGHLSSNLIRCRALSSPEDDAGARHAPEAFSLIPPMCWAVEEHYSKQATHTTSFPHPLFVKLHPQLHLCWLVSQTCRSRHNLDVILVFLLSRQR